MAEVFGVVSGAIGIISAFKTCVDCFDYIQLARSFGSKFQTDLLTLSLLQLRLSRWGEAVDIYHDPNLGNPNATRQELQLARYTMNQILLVLDESRKTSEKFRGNGGDTSVITTDDLDRNAAAAYQRIKALAASRQKSATLTKLTSWALYHRNHFSRLIQDITQLLDNLEQAFPAPFAQSTLAKAEIEEISSGDDTYRLSALQLLSEGSAEVDSVFEARTAATRVKRSIVIGSIEVSDYAGVHNGTRYGESWRGVSTLPKSDASLYIGSIRAGGNSRIRNGDDYCSSRDEFL